MTDKNAPSYYEYYDGKWEITSEHMQDALSALDETFGAKGASNGVFDAVLVQTHLKDLGFYAEIGDDNSIFFDSWKGDDALFDKMLKALKALVPFAEPDTEMVFQSTVDRYDAIEYFTDGFHLYATQGTLAFVAEKTPAKVI